MNFDDCLPLSVNLSISLSPSIFVLCLYTWPYHWQLHWHIVAIGFLPFALSKCHVTAPRHLPHFWGTKAIRGASATCSVSLALALSLDENRWPESPWLCAGTLRELIIKRFGHLIACVNRTTSIELDPVTNWIPFDSACSAPICIVVVSVVCRSCCVKRELRAAQTFAAWIVRTTLCYNLKCGVWRRVQSLRGLFKLFAL